MTATYTFDVFCSLDGYGSYNNSGDWGKQGPEFLDRRLALYGEEQRMVLAEVPTDMPTGLKAALVTRLADHLLIRGVVRRVCRSRA